MFVCKEFVNLTVKSQFCFFFLYLIEVFFQHLALRARFTRVGFPKVSHFRNQGGHKYKRAKGVAVSNRGVTRHKFKTYTRYSGVDSEEQKKSSHI